MLEIPKQMAKHILMVFLWFIKVFLKCAIYFSCFHLYSGTIEISRFNDWAKQSPGGRILLGILEMLETLPADTPATASTLVDPLVSRVSPLKPWLSPVNPESDLAKRMSVMD